MSEIIQELSTVNPFLFRILGVARTKTRKDPERFPLQFCMVHIRYLKSEFWGGGGGEREGRGNQDWKFP